MKQKCQSSATGEKQSLELARFNRCRRGKKGTLARLDMPTFPEELGRLTLTNGRRVAASQQPWAAN